MTKPNLRDINTEAPAEPSAAAPDPFSPESLRLSQSFAETVGVKKLLTTVPVRKPSKQDWIRVHPDPTYCESFAIIELKDEREEYIVHASVVAELLGEIVNKQLFLAINRQGTVFFWPVRLPTPDGKDSTWWVSARDGADRASRSWMRVVPNLNLGAYEISEAPANFSDPTWPELSYWDLIKIAFRDHLITSLDHPVVKRLRGLI